jgi:hypothetical protein
MRATVRTAKFVQGIERRPTLFHATAWLATAHSTAPAASLSAIEAPAQLVDDTRVEHWLGKKLDKSFRAYPVPPLLLPRPVLSGRRRAPCAGAARAREGRPRALAEVTGIARAKWLFQEVANQDDEGADPRANQYAVRAAVDALHVGQTLPRRHALQHWEGVACTVSIIARKSAAQTAARGNPHGSLSKTAWDAAGRASLTPESGSRLAAPIGSRFASTERAARCAVHLAVWSALFVIVDALTVEEELHSAFFGCLFLAKGHEVLVGLRIRGATETHSTDVSRLLDASPARKHNHREQDTLMAG